MVAIIRCCVRCWGPFGLAQLLGGERSRGTRDPTGDPRFCPTSLGGADGDGTPPLPFRSRGFIRRSLAKAERVTLPCGRDKRDPPVVSGRWRVLGAASRRAIASRKAVPADVKDQSCVPLHGSFQRERGKVYPIPPPNASGDSGKLKFRARLGCERAAVPRRRLEGGCPS